MKLLLSRERCKFVRRDEHTKILRHTYFSSIVVFKLTGGKDLKIIYILHEIPLQWPQDRNILAAYLKKGGRT